MGLLPATQTCVLQLRLCRSLMRKPKISECSIATSKTVLSIADLAYEN